MMHPQAYYLDLFQVSQQQLEAVVAEGLRSGGGFCDLFFENTDCADLLLRDGEVSSGGSHVDFGVGIRVLCGEKTGYAYSESTAFPAMMSAARAASAIAQKSVPAMAPQPLAPAPGDRYPVLQDWRQTKASGLVPFLQKLEQAVRARDNRIIKVIAMLSSTVSDILMFNSFGEIAFETRPMASLSLSVIFQQGGTVENKSVSRSWRTGAEMLTDELIATLSDEAVKGIDERFAARRPKGGQMSVVMASGASGILLHEAMGHAFEADFNRKGQSIFSDRMGSRICAKGIQIVDDGTLPGNRGAVGWDDEGVPGQKTYMVEDGVLTSYLHDRISAAWYGVAPTGNGRRESFRYAPIPRMRATYMEAGGEDPRAIVERVKEGIFVDQFSNGQVKIGEGDFTFFVKSGWLIENGRLTMPVKDINIIGNGPQALSDIVAVGSDLKIDEGAWTCGKEQSCPVSCGIPTVLVSRLTVGGVEG